LLAEALAARRPLIVAEAAKDPRLDPAHDVPQGITPRDMLFMPVLADGKPVAVMQATNTLDGEGFDDETIIILGAIGAQIQGAIDRARLADAYVEKLKLDESLKLAASIQMS